MKVLIITEEQYPYTLGGGTSYLNEYTLGLERYKIDYEVIATKYYRNGPKLDRKSVKNLGVPLIKSRFFPIRSLFKVYYYVAWYISILIYLLWHDKIKEFGIIHVHEPLFSAFIALLIAKISRKKIVLTEHGVYVEGIKDRMHFPNFFYKILHAMERFSVSKMDCVFCISREIRDYYLRINKNSIFIPNFIDTAKFKKRKFKDLKVIAYIGRLSKEKSVDIIIESAKFFPDLEFWIIGDGPERENLEDLAKNIGVKNVKFLGRRSNISELHGKIDLVVYLWKNEPFGLSAMEAMASGIPVIAADTNELHYFVGKAGAGIVIPKDKISSDSLAVAIKKMENKKFYVKSADNAFKTSSLYDYRKVVSEYIEGYQKVLNN